MLAAQQRMQDMMRQKQMAQQQQNGMFQQMPPQTSQMQPRPSMGEDGNVAPQGPAPQQDQMAQMQGSMDQMQQAGGMPPQGNPMMNQQNRFAEILKRLQQAQQGLGGQPPQQGMM